MNFLSKLAGTLVLLVVMMQNAAAGVSQTPYQQLQEILNEYYIVKEAVTDELTAREIECVSVDVANQFKVPEYVLMGSKTVGEMLTNILQYKYADKKGAEWAWRQIQYSSKFEDYALFILNYPNSKHLTEVYSKLIVIRLYDAFYSLEESDSIEEACREYLNLYSRYSYFYETFIRKYECGGCGIQCIDYEGFSYFNPEEWAGAVREFLQDKKEEQQLWKAALREDTHDAYWDYYVSYPQSATADSAIERTKEFEQTAWNKALERDSRNAYEEFIGQFPKGYYSNEAYRKIVQECIDTISTEADINDLEEYCDYDHPGYSLICIGNINNKGKSYKVTLTGDLGYRMTLKPGEYKWLEVLDGDYSILIEAEGATPHWGNISCYGYIYAQAWYMHEYYSFLPEIPALPVFGDQPSHRTNKNEIDVEAEQRFLNAVSAQCADNE